MDIRDVIDELHQINKLLKEMITILNQVRDNQGKSIMEIKEEKLALGDKK